MKKIIVTLFLFVNILIFLEILAIYEYKDYVYIRQIETAHTNVVRKWIEFNDNGLNIDNQNLFTFFKELTKRYDLMVSIRLGNFSKNQYEFYFASSTDIDKRLDLLTSKSLNFIESDQYYYTTQSTPNNVDGVHFFLLNKGLTVNLYPLDYLSEMPNTTVSFVAGSQDDLDNSISLLMKNYGEYFTISGEPSSTPYNVQDEINAFLPLAIAISMSCAFLLLMIYVNFKSKKISVMKMMGISIWSSGIRLFGTLYCFIILAIITTNIALFIAFIRVINEKTIPLIIDLAKVISIQVVCISVVITISCILLTFIPTYSLLKNSHLNRSLMNVNFVLKIIVLLTILPMLSGKLGIVLKDLSVVNYANQLMTKDYQLVERYKMEHTSDGYDLFEFGKEFFQNFDPEIINSHEILYEYHHAYRIMNEAGAILCKNYEQYGNEPERAISGIIVNENYLRKYPVVDVTGVVIDIDKIKADVVYLIPEYYFNLEYPTEEFYKYDPYGNTNYEMVVISSKQSIPAFDPFLGYDFLKRPFAITLYKDTAFRLDASIFSGLMTDKNINELLSGSIFHDKIIIATLKDHLAETKSQILKNTKEELRLILPTFALFIIIIIQYTYLYIKVYGQQIYVHKLLGHNPFYIFGRLLFESSLTVIIATINALLRGNDYLLLLFILGFDISIYTLTVLFSQNVRAKYFNVSES